MNKKSGNVLVVALAIVAVLSLSLASYFFYQNQQLQKSFDFAQDVSPTPTPVVNDETKNWKTYSNGEFSFKYPEKLNLVNGNIVTLNHSIPYKNNGGCDMSGLNTKQYDNLADFNVSFELKNTKIIPKYSDGKYDSGSLSGVWRLNGAEGCGEEVYYFNLPNEKTLIVTKSIVQAFTGISTMWNLDEILKIPGVITKEESNSLFNQILGTFRILE